MGKLKVQIRENSLLARVAALKMGYDSVAIVFGKTIHLHNTSKADFFAKPTWVFHEFKHLEQYQQLGLFRFLIQYLREFRKNGYYDNAFEVEARAAEGHPEIMESFDLSAYQQFVQKDFGKS
ncbi:MAG: DUF4157 domain-containing protein [Chitinophagaceae bacterium]